MHTNACRNIDPLLDILDQNVTGCAKSINATHVATMDCKDWIK
jgi:hypothetical protein